MKKFSSFKTVDEIRQQCEAQGLTLDTTLYDAGSSDYIKIRSNDGKTSAKVLYSSFNGRFFGETAAGLDSVKFSSDDATFDGTPWFDALLDFFYVRKVEGASA
jgi:hypothetical protein